MPPSRPLFSFKGCNSVPGAAGTRSAGGRQVRFSIVDASRNPTLLRWQGWRLLDRGSSFRDPHGVLHQTLKSSETTTKRAIPAPRSRILMTSASPKSMRNHYKMQERAENGSETTTKRTIPKKGLMRRFFEAPTPSSQKRKLAPKPTRNAQSRRASARAPARTGSECHACHTRP